MNLPLFNLQAGRKIIWRSIAALLLLVPMVANADSSAFIGRRTISAGHPLSSDQQVEGFFQNPFAEVVMENEIIMARLPESGIRWKIKTGAVEEVSSYGQVLHFRPGDEMVLFEKHASYTIRAETRDGRGLLHCRYVSDGRAFGDGMTTTIGTIEAIPL